MPGLFDMLQGLEILARLGTAWHSLHVLLIRRENRLPSFKIQLLFPKMRWNAAYFIKMCCILKSVSPFTPPSVYNLRKAERCVQNKFWENVCTEGGYLQKFLSSGRVFWQSFCILKRFFFCILKVCFAFYSPVRLQLKKHQTLCRKPDLGERVHWRWMFTKFFELKWSFSKMHVKNEKVLRVQNFELQATPLGEACTAVRQVRLVFKWPLVNVWAR